MQEENQVLGEEGVSLSWTKRENKTVNASAGVNSRREEAPRRNVEETMANKRQTLALWRKEQGQEREKVL